MLTSVQAALVFSVIIVPGFLFVQGLHRGRPRIARQQPLHDLAEAVVASLLLLAMGWWLGGRDIVRWVGNGTAASSHRDATYWFFLGLLMAPFPLGLALGGTAEWLLRHLLDARSPRRLATIEATVRWTRPSRTVR